MNRLAIKCSAGEFRLSDYDPGQTCGLTERDCTRILNENKSRIAELQNVLYAEKKQSMLVVLQAMDTGGKDPVIRDVLSAANPQACRVTAFKKPSPSETQRGRFWRFQKELPALGEIGVFNRSYYDDIISEQAHDGSKEDAGAYEQVRLFERILAGDKVRVLKVFFYMSKDEQRRRLQERIDDPTRHWELSDSDFTERQYWDGYMRAYEEAIRRTGTEEAPWYVVTSDQKWFRDAATSKLIVEALEGMAPQYPPSTVDLTNIVWY